MTYVVVYDIADDAIRARVASILTGYGHRVQESVFECVVDDERELEGLTERLRGALVDAANGQIRVYRVCGKCLEASFGLGSVEPHDTAACFIV
ncbi:MAG: CRISPR-associated endonuclease Cas2 [Acidobacteriota bacterium]|nr:CRISPR-associated endonuclease Cas2 [Acidobacteriota bacterium]